MAIRTIIHLTTFLERKVAKNFCAKLRFAAVQGSGIVVVVEREQNANS